MLCLCQKTLKNRAISVLAERKEKPLNREIRLIATTFGVAPKEIYEEIAKTKEAESEYPFSIEALKHTRKNLMNVSQAEAARLLDISYNTYQGYEQGKFKMPEVRWKIWLNMVNQIPGVEKNGKEDLW